MEKKIDYDIIVQAIASYLLGAMDFIGEYKNDFSVGLIPDGHHIYTGTLKAAGYRLLKPAKTLVMIGDGAVNNKISVFDNKLAPFMGKKWKMDDVVLSKIFSLDDSDFVQHKFDWIDAEMAFLRVISDYDNVVFIEIGDRVSKIKATNLLFDLSKTANLMFMSDFHKDKPIGLCKELDVKILDLDFVKKNQELFLVEIFLRLSKKYKREPNLVAYMNTGDISFDKNITNGFGCMFL